MEYIKRIIDKELKRKLSSSGAVYIKGPKWCGKTTTAKQFAKSVLEVQNPDNIDNNIELANNKPSLLLIGDKPRLIDEWQIIPKIWNAVRYAIDQNGDTNQFILTGSAVPKEDKTLHSGVGRFSFLEMLPMSLYESGDSNGKISLKDLFSGKKNIDGITSELDYEKIAYVLCRGGWPASLNMNKDVALDVSKNYIDAVVESDISNIDGTTRNPELARTILKSYARQTSTIDSNKSLFKDVQANFGNVSEATILDYLNQLKKLYIIKEIPAWNPNIRSKTAIRTANKKSMIDPSLAVASLGCSYNDLIMDSNTYGLLFENLVTRDLNVYLLPINGHVAHYRDRYDLECDNILKLDDGRYALVEIKLGSNHIEEAEKHLLKLKDLINANEPKLGDPSFMMIITGTNLAYTTSNGVLVIPIGCLKN